MDENPTLDVDAIVRRAIEEYAKKAQSQSEPAYVAELQEERKRREELERRLNEVVEENRRNRQAAEQSERHSAIRSELQRLGVQKVDLAFRAVRDDVVRNEDGQLVARGDFGEQGLREYLGGFVNANPEFLPARIAGGSGMTANEKSPPSGSAAVDLDKIRPGMSREEMERVRQEIVRIASQTLRGL